MPDPRMLLALLLTVSLTACAEPDQDVNAEGQPAEELAAPSDAAQQQERESQLEQVRNEWVAQAEAGDAAAVAALYTEDAVFVGAGSQRMDGRQAIEQGLAEGFQALTDMEVTSQATEFGTELTSDFGTWSQTLTTGDGEQTIEGYYLVVMRRLGDASWQIAHHLSVPFEDEQAPAATDADTGESPM